MASLVDKSLLRQEEGLEGEPRFRMLETVREYGLERLEAAGKRREEPSARVTPHIFAQLAIDSRADLSAGGSRYGAVHAGLRTPICGPWSPVLLEIGDAGDGATGGWRKSERILVRGWWRDKRSCGLA